MSGTVRATAGTRAVDRLDAAEFVAARDVVPVTGLVSKRGIPAGAAGAIGGRGMLLRVARGTCVWTIPTRALSRTAVQFLRVTPADARKAERLSASLWRASCAHVRMAWLVPDGSGRRSRSSVRLRCECVVCGPFGPDAEVPACWRSVVGPRASSCAISEPADIARIANGM